LCRNPLHVSGVKRLSSGSTTLFFSVKKSRQTNLFHVSHRSFCGERYPFTGHFYISLETLVIFLFIRFFSSKALRKGRPSMFPQSRAPVERDSHSRALLNIFRAPLHEVPSEREAPFLESLFIFLSPRLYDPPFQIPGFPRP
jgi:hypothetical protein